MKDYSGTNKKVTSGMIAQCSNYNDKYVKTNTVGQGSGKPSETHSGVAKNDSMSVSKSKGKM